MDLRPPGPAPARVVVREGLPLGSNERSGATQLPRGGAASSVVIARVALVGSALLLPLLVLELGLRIFGPFLPGNYETGAYLVRHPLYGHYHPENFSGWIKTDEYAVPIRTNREGQRGPDIPTAKPPGVFRILVLGDSFVEAVQVAENERFLARLDAILNSPGAPRRFELIDGSCSGWGTAQEYLYLQHEGPRYRPDLVLLVFFVGNDVQNNSLELELGGRADLALKPYFALTGAGSLQLLEPHPPELMWRERLASLLRERSTLYNVVESAVVEKLGLGDVHATWRDVDALEEMRTARLDLYQPLMDDRWREAWAITDALVGMLKDEASAQDSRLALALAPTHGQVSSQAWSAASGRYKGLDDSHPARMLATTAARTSTPLLDLLPALRRQDAKPDRPPLYFRRDLHWTSAGHAVVARSIAEFLRRERLIPPG